MPVTDISMAADMYVTGIAGIGQPLAVCAGEHGQEYAPAYCEDFR
jgi:hypothetical protein